MKVEHRALNNLNLVLRPDWQVNGRLVGLLLLYIVGGGEAGVGLEEGLVLLKEVQVGLLLEQVWVWPLLTGHGEKQGVGEEGVARQQGGELTEMPTKGTHMADAMVTNSFDFIKLQNRLPDGF